MLPLLRFSCYCYFVNFFFFSSLWQLILTLSFSLYSLPFMFVYASAVRQYFCVRCRFIAIYGLMFHLWSTYFCIQNSLLAFNWCLICVVFSHSMATSCFNTNTVVTVTDAFQLVITCAYIHKHMNNNELTHYWDVTSLCRNEYLRIGSIWSDLLTFLAKTKLMPWIYINCFI